MESWKIDQAQEQFSEVVQAASCEPQLIYNRDQLVAAVIEGKLFQEFLMWQKHKKQGTIADAFTNLRQIMSEENYSLEIPIRQDRANPFIDELSDVSL